MPLPSAVFLVAAAAASSCASAFDRSHRARGHRTSILSAVATGPSAGYFVVHINHGGCDDVLANFFTQLNGTGRYKDSDSYSGAPADLRDQGLDALNQSSQTKEGEGYRFVFANWTECHRAARLLFFAEFPSTRQQPPFFISNSCGELPSQAVAKLQSFSMLPAVDEEEMRTCTKGRSRTAKLQPATNSVILTLRPLMEGGTNTVGTVRYMFNACNLSARVIITELAHDTRHRASILSAVATGFVVHIHHGIGDHVFAKFFTHFNGTGGYKGSDSYSGAPADLRDQGLSALQPASPITIEQYERYGFVFANSTECHRAARLLFFAEFPSTRQPPFFISNSCGELPSQAVAKLQSFSITPAVDEEEMRTCTKGSRGGCNKPVA